MIKYIFDVDGTLTPSRQKIDPEFSTFMLNFACEHDVYLVTGSDRDKTLEQVGEELYNKSKLNLNYNHVNLNNKISKNVIIFVFFT